LADGARLSEIARVKLHLTTVNKYKCNSMPKGSGLTIFLDIDRQLVL
jgi:hypothetical protein